MKRNTLLLIILSAILISFLACGQISKQQPEVSVTIATEEESKEQYFVVQRSPNGENIGVEGIQIGMPFPSIPDSIEGLYDHKDIESDDYGTLMCSLYRGSEKVMEVCPDEDDYYYELKSLKKATVRCIVVYSPSILCSPDSLRVGTSIRELIEKYGYTIEYVDYGDMCDFPAGLYATSPSADYPPLFINGECKEEAKKKASLNDDGGQTVIVSADDVISGEVRCITIQ